RRCSRTRMRTRCSPSSRLFAHTRPSARSWTWVGRFSETTRNLQYSNRTRDPVLRGRALTRRIPRFQRNPKPWKTLGSRKLIDLGEVKIHRDKIISKNGFRDDILQLRVTYFT